MPRSSPAAQSYDEKWAVSPRERRDHLPRDPFDLEALTVPELVRRHDLRAWDHPGERCLSGGAVAADPDENEAAVGPAAATRSSNGRASIAARYPDRMEKLRLGGMALSNGVLVHGPTAWGAAVRAPDGSIRSASGVKRRFAPNVSTPFVRGPLRLAEAFAVLPDVRRALPEARFPFERPRVAAAVVVGVAAAASHGGRSSSLPAREAIAALASLAPALIALRGGELASYHGAEHISIGTYETGEPATKEHDRCGGHLVGPLMLTSAVASALASQARPARVPLPGRSAPSARSALRSRSSAGWDKPDHPLSRALARPGHELQSRLSTAEPSAAQLEVAGAALRRVCGRRARVSTPSVRGERLDPERLRAPGREDAGGLLHRRVLQPHSRRTARRRSSSPRPDAGLSATYGDARRHGRGNRDPQALLARLGCAQVIALYDGDTIEPWETVMTIEGDYTLFAHLETVYLGVLARRTLIATNTERVLRAANGKPVIFMPARHDHHRVQTGDGYAAYVAGAISGTEIGVTSDAQASWWGGRGVGTVPHALVAAYGGDTVLAATRFAAWAPADLHITVLVDFENDSVATALAVADALGAEALGGSLGYLEPARRPFALGGDGRLRSAWSERASRPQGAQGARRRRARRMCGLSPRRILGREDRGVRAAGVPVDAYGVGSSLIRGENDFTADIVVTDGRPSAKVGRRLRPNPRHERVD